MHRHSYFSHQCIIACLAFLQKIILSVTALEAVCVLFLWNTDNLLRATVVGGKLCIHTSYFTYYEWQCMAIYCSYLNLGRNNVRLRKNPEI